MQWRSIAASSKLRTSPLRWRPRAFGLAVDLEATTFFVRHETLVPARISALAKWKRNLFIRIYRSAQDAAQFYHLPPGRVVELGSQTEI